MFPRVLLLLTCAFLCSSASSPDAAQHDQAWRREYARPQDVPYPESDAYSPAKASLGRRLFFDGRLSRSGQTSCSSCHDPALSWGDGLAHALGEAHTPMAVRSPTLLGVAWGKRYGWDGKFRNLEAVAFGPLLNPVNMDMTEPEVIARVSADPSYLRAFDEAFGEATVDRKGIEDALATYERSIVPGVAPFDRWLAGDERAVTPAAKRGFELFRGKAGCSACHSGWRFTDDAFHDVGVGTGKDVGRGRLFPTSPTLQYAFKTPTLRDAARRRPYMHDGTVRTLAEVVDLYDKGGIDRPSRAPEVHALGLTDDEKDDLVAFVETLSSDEFGAH